MINEWKQTEVIIWRCPNPYCKHNICDTEYRLFRFNLQCPKCKQTVLSDFISRAFKNCLKEK